MPEPRVNGGPVYLDRYFYNPTPEQRTKWNEDKYDPWWDSNMPAKGSNSPVAALGWAGACIPTNQRQGCAMTLKDRLIQATGRDLRACFADVFGYKHVSPDQEAHIEAIQTQAQITAMGGTGVGKSFDQGVAAAIILATTCPTKGLFGGPKREQAAKLSWLELLRAYRAAAERGIRLSDNSPGVTDWYPQGKDKWPDWFASCMALSENDNAAAVKGMMHARRVVVALDELNGIASEVQQALDSGTTQDNVTFMVSFNPVDPTDAAGKLWDETAPAGRIQFSAIRCAEWQERTGIKLPGMPTLEAIERKWHGRENEPLYYTNVLGVFPPQSADNLIVPKDWFKLCVNCITEPPIRGTRATLGIDTGGGRAETGGIGMLGSVVQPARAGKEGHDTIATAVAMRDYAFQLGPDTDCIVDWVGLGGKGVGEQLLAMGNHVLVFRGGARTLWRLTSAETEEPVAKCPGLYHDNATWAYFAVRDLVRRTVEAIKAGRPERYISFPDDDVLCDQLARRFMVDSQDKSYKLESKKDSGKPSPDRGDMVAMAALAMSAGQPEYERIVTADDIMGKAEAAAYRGQDVGGYGGGDDNIGGY